MAIERTMPDDAVASMDKWRRPPLLVGYTYEPAKAWLARDEGRLLAIRLETNRTCNLRCRYCYAESGVDPKAVGPYEVLVDRVEQAHGLGAESIVVIGVSLQSDNVRFPQSRIVLFSGLPPEAARARSCR
jgi:hypothetical protein